MSGDEVGGLPLFLFDRKDITALSLLFSWAFEEFLSWFWAERNFCFWGNSWCILINLHPWGDAGKPLRGGGRGMGTK
jgi:hypothetical protein